MQDTLIMVSSGEMVTENYIFFTILLIQLLTGPTMHAQVYFVVCVLWSHL